MNKFNTQNVVQVEIFFLLLNSIHANAEHRNTVAIAASEEDLKQWYDSQLLEKTEVIGRMHYAFQEGALRNCNPLAAWEHVDNSTWGHGWTSSWETLPLLTASGNAELVNIQFPITADTLEENL